MTERIVVGNAELWHGDCLDILHDVSFDSVVTDPSYGMEFESGHRFISHGKIHGDESITLLVMACNIPCRHSKYVFCRWSNLLQGIPKPTSCITWVKNNWSMGNLEHEHARQTEVILFYPGSEHFWPKSRPSDVMNCARTLNSHHPTEKPVRLMEDIVSLTNGTVLDPFMGSGTTGVACARLGKKFTGIERERKYFDIACERIAAAHSQGKLFDGPGDAYDQVSGDYQQDKLL